MIELLIVISIIAILSAILLPSLNKAREKGSAIHCTGNQKQIGAGLINYGVDFNDFYPIAKRNDGYRWHCLLMKMNYAIAKSFVCNSSLKQTNYCKSFYEKYALSSYPMGLDDPSAWQWQYCGYGINAAEMGGGRESTGNLAVYPMLRQPLVKNPSRFIVAGESGPKNAGGNIVPTFRVRNVFGDDTLYPYHNGNRSANLLFGDGSSRSIVGNAKLPSNIMINWYSASGPVKNFSTENNQWTWNGKLRWDENAKR